MKIESTDKTVKGVLSQGYYKIPRFQRSFSWEKDQLEEFWSDTISDAESEYFIGSIVVYQEDSSHDILGIVDGQQRLTTITLILCALRNAFKLEDEGDLAQGVHNLIERSNINNIPEYVLQPETSYPYFQEHIQKNTTPDANGKAGEEEELLKAAFELVSKNIQDTVISINIDKTLSELKRKQKIKDMLIEIRDKVLNLKLIHITLDNEDDAYVIFETLNTRGKDLSIGDLLKNYLFKPIKKTNAQVDVFKDKWSEILIIIREIDVKIDEFLYHHWLSKHERYVPAKKLFKAIKKKITPTKAKNYLNELHSDAIVYKKIVVPTASDWGKNNSKIYDSLRALKIFRVKQQIPFVLSVLRELDNGSLKNGRVAEILGEIENFHFVFSAVTSQRSSGGISSMYAKHAIELAEKTLTEDKIAVLSSLKNELKKRIPSYEEFEANFKEIIFTNERSTQKKLVQYILAKLHSHHQPDIPIDYEKMTIEHLLPQKPLFGQVVPAEIIGQIGNLILLSEPDNNKLSNKSFTEKMTYLKNLKIWIDEDVQNTTLWERGEIDLRTRKLAELAYQEIWS